ncbi:heme/hemin ABC transporter substrate-binding protein [Enterobacillus tribolii]|uniref:Iron complex transport system substrate-binding protein n=1 Tax=Enterobacillus tribolii TaxID=1487935 RepID=A0A370R3Q8_9GAMM|nr:ABC transporter substrate-binding protein [Enterobacillus tribolii]MBW7984099.1 hemin ABC transporter substrate-binding protein [Enterobacillus tribolii]RDK97039.1 iron complex transport system substrate-binding protein [Enterobacillus tribolii]
MKPLLPILYTALLLFNQGASAAERIITIGGDVTEIAWALGAGKELVARDTTSTHPAGVQKLPDVGYMRQLNAEGILSLKPTLVLVSDLAQPSLVLEQVANAGVRVVNVTGETTLDAVPRKISQVAAALGQESQGNALTTDYRRQIDAVPRRSLPVKVLFILSHGGMTPMAAGQDTAADAVIRAAGATNAMQGFSRYRPLSQEGVIASAPDLILITLDGVKTLGGLENIWRLPGMSMTPAAKNKAVLALDDMALLGFTLNTPDALAKLRQAAEKAAL